jgi:hypothetical protein
MLCDARRRDNETTVAVDPRNRYGSASDFVFLQISILIYIKFCDVTIHILHTVTIKSPALQVVFCYFVLSYLTAFVILLFEILNLFYQYNSIIIYITIKLLSLNLICCAQFVLMKLIVVMI